MNAPRSSWTISSRYVTIINKLFQGLSPSQISPGHDEQRFWQELLSLEPDRIFLTRKLSTLSKDECLTSHKLVLHALFTVCIIFAADRKGKETRTHAIDTLSIMLRTVLAKNLAGWEVMEIFANRVNEADRVFMEFVGMVADILGDDDAPEALRHQVLQLAVVFTCSISQLSPGAYFLRRDLFPCISKVITSPDTQRFTFEASLLLSILANFHKSDAAKLNPYLQRIRDTQDTEVMRKICWAAGFALDAAVKAYQEVSDDSIPTFAKSVGALFTSFLPDRALVTQSLDIPLEFLKTQPIEATVSLLPVFEFLFFNPLFAQVLVDVMHKPSDSKQSALVPPLSHNILSLSSYVLTHASSSASPRTLAYAKLALNTLLVMSENAHIMSAFCKPASSKEAIRLCRQRLPLLPVPSPTRAPICALLDCCVLWLRHNLHKRLEVYAFTTCIWTCYRVIWYLQKERLRLEYDWLELWKAIVDLLGFLSGKLDSLVTTGGIEHLVQETIRLLDLALRKADLFLPTPTAVHEFIYEVVRSSAVIRKQTQLLESLGQPTSVDRGASLRSDSASKALSRVLSTVAYYEGKLTSSGTRSAKDAFRTVSKNIEQNGLHSAHNGDDTDPPKHAEDIVSFIRVACADGLALMS
ncbi:uncharacterized protein EDB93DRAFT_1127654 [Suillus bovinus]|uniref:uncharacterized protein n=1 Tax=Suillus bovinus TaxID=48563 RepID=UPI001B8630CC|nr:uncharacterized protein EDB93DRAFT_1127654 [Suillus bovinus]KAG2156639.1 hypothetical protein EDB93DRAFT_1127654 [Suillus bovinus]